MSHAKTSGPAARPPSGAPPKLNAAQRRGRVWIINKRFQLKYTFMLVGVVLSVAVALGLVVGRMAHAALLAADEATVYAERAFAENAANNKLARDNAMLAAGDNQVLLKIMESSIDEASAKSQHEVDEVRAAAARLRASAETVLVVVFAAIALLGVALTIIGLRMTQRIVGPVHRLKRLLRRVGTGKLTTHERLRKGDELEDLFDTFQQMTYSLMAMQHGRLATLKATLREARMTGAAEPVIDGLEALRAQLELGLGVDAALKRSGELRALSMTDINEARGDA